MAGKITVLLESDAALSAQRPTPACSIDHVNQAALVSIFMRQRLALSSARSAYLPGRQPSRWASTECGSAPSLIATSGLWP